MDPPASPFIVTGSLLHDALTPGGNPPALKVTGPFNGSLLASATATVAVEPCTIGTGEEPTVTVSTGGGSVTVSRKLWLAA
jgi:hypothetical protein